MSAGRRDQRTPGSPPVRTRRCATLPTWRRQWRGTAAAGDPRLLRLLMATSYRHIR